MRNNLIICAWLSSVSKDECGSLTSQNKLTDLISINLPKVTGILNGEKNKGKQKKELRDPKYINWMYIEHVVNQILILS